jgi:hypothetical protein
MIWDEQPQAVQALFNPAFCAALLGQTVRAYSESGFDLALAYVALPLILHADTRNSLPGSVATTIPAWRERQPELTLGFFERARAMRPFVDAAIIFGARSGLFKYDDQNAVLLRSRSIDRSDQLSDDRFAESSKCLERAKFIGRWFSRAGSTAVIFALLGVEL